MTCEACFKRPPFMGVIVNSHKNSPGERWCWECLELLTSEVHSGNENNPTTVAKAKAIAGPPQDMGPTLYIDKETIAAVETLVLDEQDQPRLVCITMKLEREKDEEEQKSKAPA